jgi:hypothetical protein
VFKLTIEGGSRAANTALTRELSRALEILGLEVEVIDEGFVPAPGPEVPPVDVRLRHRPVRIFIKNSA